MDSFQGNSRKRKGDDAYDQQHASQRRRHEPLEDGVAFKLLVSGDKVGGIIGKGGDMIKRLRDATRSTIIVHPSVQGCHDRTVFIESERMPEAPTCPAREAVLKCLACAIGPGGPDDTPREVHDPPQGHTVKLLVHTGYSGPIIGKGAATINEIKAHSGANVLVLHDERHPLKSPHEDIVKVTGTYQQVCDAMALVVEHMRQVPPPMPPPGGDGPRRPPPHMRDSFGGRDGPLGPLPPMPDLFPPAGPRGMAMPDLGPEGFGTVPEGFRRVAAGVMVCFHSPGDAQTMVNTEYRMMIPHNIAGKFIGKGGEALKEARANLGCQGLSIHPLQPGQAYRVLEVVSLEPAASQHCSALDALIYYAQRLMNELPGPEVEVKMLVPQGQAGAVLGHKKTIISQLPAVANCVARMYSAVETPRCGRDNDQMLLLKGPRECVMEGLRIAAMLLRGYIVRNLKIEALEPNPNMTLARLVAISSAAAAMGMGLGVGVMGAMGPMAAGMASMPPRPMMGSRMVDGMGAGSISGMMGGNSDIFGVAMGGALGGAAASNGSGATLNSGMMGMGGAGATGTATAAVGNAGVAGGGVAAPVKLTVMVPASMAYQPSGINEANMEQVRSVTGANVSLSQQRLPTGECELSISGTMSQAMQAHTLISNIMQVGAALQQQFQQQQQLQGLQALAQAQMLPMQQQQQQQAALVTSAPLTSLVPGNTLANNNLLAYIPMAGGQGAAQVQQPGAALALPASMSMSMQAAGTAALPGFTTDSVSGNTAASAFAQHAAVLYGGSSAALAQSVQQQQQMQTQQQAQQQQAVTASYNNTYAQQYAYLAAATAAAAAAAQQSGPAQQAQAAGAVAQQQSSSLAGGPAAAPAVQDAKKRPNTGMFYNW